MLSEEEFYKYREGILDQFYSESIFRRQKLTQGAYWTNLGKDIANQYFRDERWFFGIKYLDEIKFIDHGLDPENTEKVKIGFTNKKQ